MCVWGTSVLRRGGNRRKEKRRKKAGKIGDSGSV